MHTEPTDTSAPLVLKTKPESSKAVKKTKPPMVATRNGLTKPTKGARPKATSMEVPLPGVPTRYYGKPMKLDPASIELSRWSNRLPDFVDTSAFHELRDQMAKTGGNTVPVLVRLLPDSTHELVYGHRRLMACKLIGLKVNALVARGLTDEEAIRHMAHENIGRHDLSPFEQGRWYARLREEQVYETDSALSRALGVDKGDLSKALALARLHPVIIDAFSSSHDLQYRFASGLARASEPKSGEADIESTEIYQRALAIAALRSSAGSKLDGRAVYGMLLATKPLQPAAVRTLVTCSEVISCASQEVLKMAPFNPAGNPGSTDEYQSKIILEVNVAACENGAQKQPQEEPSVGPSNTVLPTFRKQNKEAVSLGAIDEERAECPSVVAQEICMAACQSSSGKTASVGRSNIWCPIMTDDTNVIGAVTAAENGTALVELSLALSEQQCDLLALAVGKLLSDAQYAGTTPSDSSLNDQEAS